MLLVDAVQVREAILSKAVVVAMWILLSCCILLSARTRRFCECLIAAQTLSCYRALCSSHFLHDAGQGNWHWRWVRRGQVRARGRRVEEVLCSDSKWKASPETKENCAISVLQRRAAQPLSQKVWCFRLWEILRTSQGFALARIGGKRMRWNEMEGGLRWLKQLHQPESACEGFHRMWQKLSRRQWRKRHKAMHWSRTPDDFWRQQGQFDDILIQSCLMFIWIVLRLLRLQKLFSFLFSLDLGILHDVTMLGKRQEAEMQLSTGPPSFGPLRRRELWQVSGELLWRPSEPCDLHPANHLQITSTSLPHQQFHMF